MHTRSSLLYGMCGGRAAWSGLLLLAACGGEKPAATETSPSTPAAAQAPTAPPPAQPAPVPRPGPGGAEQAPVHKPGPPLTPASSYCQDWSVAWELRGAFDPKATEDGWNALLTLKSGEAGALAGQVEVLLPDSPTLPVTVRSRQGTSLVLHTSQQDMESPIPCEDRLTLHLELDVGEAPKGQMATYCGEPGPQTLRSQVPITVRPLCGALPPT